MPMLTPIPPSILSAIGITAAVLTTLCWLPQTIKVIRHKETGALSLSANVLFAIGILLWLIYGIGIGDWPVIGANATSLVLILVIIVMKLRHG
jgi:MtN3 and saliva related transmembrane protein